MFVLSQRADFANRVIATLVAVALVLGALGITQFAQAANLTNVSNTLTTSEPSEAAGHTISFTVPEGSEIEATDLITIEFPAGFTNVANATTGSLAVDVDLAVQTIGAFDSDATSIEFNNVVAAENEVVTIVITEGIINNPATIDSYEFYITTGAGGDTGRTVVAIVDSVLVQAVVQPVFTFIVTGTATGTDINGTTTTGSTTSSLIDFGVLAADTVYTMGQRLNVTTNARHGYIVTVEKTQEFQSSTGAIIDTFFDGTDVDVPQGWQGPGGDIDTPTEWGHWGMTTTDGNLQGGGNDFDVNQWIAVPSAPRVIMAHDDPTNGTFGNDDASGDDTGETFVAYQVQITPLQEAADDYNTTLIYVATPTF